MKFFIMICAIIALSFPAWAEKPVPAEPAVTETVVAEEPTTITADEDVSVEEAASWLDDVGAMFTELHEKIKVKYHSLLAEKEAADTEAVPESDEDVNTNIEVAPSPVAVIAPPNQ